MIESPWGCMSASHLKNHTLNNRGIQIKAEKWLTAWGPKVFCLPLTVFTEQRMNCSFCLGFSDSSWSSAVWSFTPSVNGCFPWAQLNGSAFCCRHFYFCFYRSQRWIPESSQNKRCVSAVKRLFYWWVVAHIWTHNIAHTSAWCHGGFKCVDASQAAQVFHRAWIFCFN